MLGKFPLKIYYLPCGFLLDHNSSQEGKMKCTQEVQKKRAWQQQKHILKISQVSHPYS